MAGPVFPVQGVTLDDVTDTFGAPRGGGSRSHKGIDIFADRGTPVVATVSGRINESSYGDSEVGGKRVWIEGDDGQAHYFSHLDSIGVEPGQRVEAGQPIGTVGNTGNARTTPPHLHYSVNQAVGPEDDSVNPYNYLAGATPAPDTPDRGAEAPVTVPDVPDYPTDPAPIQAALLREFAERRRQATRQLQEAMAERERGTTETDSAFRGFLRDLERQRRDGRRHIGSEAAARNMAFQPSAQGRAMRDMLAAQASQLGDAQRQRSQQHAALEQAVNQAQRQRQETIAGIERDAGRAGGDIARLFGAR